MEGPRFIFPEHFGSFQVDTVDFETDHITNSTHLIMIKLITPLLLVIATLVTSATAKSYNIKEFTQSYRLSSSLLYFDVDGESSIESTFLVDADLDSAPGVSLEWSTLPSRSGFSIGFEYIYYTPEADISGVLDAYDASIANLLTDSTSFVAGNIGTLKEDYNSHTAFLNIASDSSLTEKISAYVGLGLGFSYIKQEFTASSAGDTYQYSADDIVFGYQIRAGLRYDINADFTINGGLRYIGFQDHDFDYEDLTFSGNFKALAVELGIAYKY